MFKKVLLWVVIAAVVLGGGYVAYQQGLFTKGAQAEAQGQAAPTLEPAVKAPVKADKGIMAEGQVVPASEVKLSFSTAGVVSEVLVSEGDAVTAGQVLARLQADRLTVGVAEAEAALALAQAQLAKAQVGPRAEDLAAAQKAVEVAQTAIASADAAAAGARARLAGLREGPTAEELAIAQHRVEEAKNALWGAQGQRDAICGRIKYGATEADCDSAEANANRSEEGVRIAELEVQRLQAAAQPSAIAAAQADLQAALAQRTTAEARVAEAQAGLARAQVGPSREDIAIAQAGVEQARVAVQRAQVALAESELRAPVAGTLVSLDVQAGAYAAPGVPVVHLADLSRLVVETTDLNELNVVHLQVGDAAQITLDALPTAKLSGTVERIDAIGQSVRGEIVYTVRIAPNYQDPQLRWNMTAAVTLGAAEE